MIVLVFTWIIRDAVTGNPIQGAGVVMNNLATGLQWLAQSDAGGKAEVFRTPVLYDDEPYDSYVVKDGYVTYSLMNTFWGDGGVWSVSLTPQTGSVSTSKIPIIPIIGGILAYVLLRK